MTNKTNKKFIGSNLQLLMIVLSLSIVTGCSGATSLFFYPDRQWYSTPEDVNQPYENIVLTAVDGTRLHGWWLPAVGNNSDTVVLYLHGNAQNISTHSHSIYWLPKSGVDVFALDYRGYGASQGDAELPGIFQDIESAALWIRRKYPEKKLIIVGQSIGAALAITFVAKAGEQYNVDAVVLDAPFIGYGTIARYVTSKSVFGLVVYPFTVFVPSRWDPRNHVSEIKVPVMIMHSKDDHVIPYEHGQQIYRLLEANGNNEACWLESQGGHIASFNYDEIRKQTLEFITTAECPDM